MTSSGFDAALNGQRLAILVSTKLPLAWLSPDYRGQTCERQQWLSSNADAHALDRELPLRERWHAWVAREERKRLALCVFVRCSGVRRTTSRSRLCSGGRVESQTDMGYIDERLLARGRTCQPAQLLGAMARPGRAQLGSPAADLHPQHQHALSRLVPAGMRPSYSGGKPAGIQKPVGFIAMTISKTEAAAA
jgi:hypothetical protein